MDGTGDRGTGHGAVLGTSRPERPDPATSPAKHQVGEPARFSKAQYYREIAWGFALQAGVSEMGPTVSSHQNNHIKRIQVRFGMNNHSLYNDLSLLTPTKKGLALGSINAKINYKVITTWHLK